MPEFNEFLPFKTIDEIIDEITALITGGTNPLVTFIEVGVDYLYDENFSYQKITFRNSVAVISEFQESSTGTYEMPVMNGRRYWLKVDRTTEKILNPGFRNLINIQKELMIIKKVTTANPFDFFSLNEAQYIEHKSALKNLVDAIKTIDLSDDDNDNNYEDTQIDLDVNLNLGFNKDYDVKWGLGE